MSPPFWGTEEGYRRLSDVLSKTNYVWWDDTSLDSYLAMSPSAHSKIQLWCSKCETAVSPKLRAFVERGRAGCACFIARRLVDPKICALVWQWSHSKDLLLPDAQSESLVASAMFRIKEHFHIRVQCRICASTTSKQVSDIVRNCNGIRCDCHDVRSSLRYTTALERLEAVDCTFVDISSHREWKEALDDVQDRVLIKIACKHCQACNAYTPSRLLSSSYSLTTPCSCGNRKRHGRNSDVFKSAIEDYVKASRFVFSDPSNPFVDASARGDVRLDLQCTICQKQATPYVSKLKSGHVGCGCSNGSEFQVFQSLKGMIRNHPQKGLAVVEQYKPGITGVHGGKLRHDFALLKDDVPLLYGEVDGGHHFGGGHASIRNHCENHTMQHDIIKERNALTTGVPLFRIEQRTIERKDCDHFTWLKRLVFAAVNGALTPGLYRLSYGQHYVVGMYADLRSGLDLPLGSSLEPPPLIASFDRRSLIASDCESDSD